MIARMWHGVTKTKDAEAYSAFLKRRAVPDYQSVAGNKGVHLLRREEGERTHFMTLTFWESRAAIEKFAGKEIERAKYYEEDKRFLLEFERDVVHYEVIG